MTRMQTNVRLLPFLGALAYAVNVDGVYAQEKAEEVAEQQLENIVVYAQKRAQNIDEVSVAVNVLQGDVLEQLHIKDTTLLSAQIPNVKITANTGEGAPPVVSIRGVGSLDYNNTTTAPVAFYNDNIAGGALSNSLLYLFDLERVEVLKGPQGTLFGRNTTGGAILLTSKRPTDGLEGYVTVSLANQNHSKMEGVFNLPFNQNTKLRAGYSYQDYDYSSNNLLDGVPQAGMEQHNFRLLVEHNKDDLNVLFKLHGADWDGVVKPVHSKGVINIDSGELCSPEEAGTLKCTDAFGFNDGSTRFHDVKIDNFSPHITERIGASIEVQYRLSGNQYLTSITGINTLDRLHTFNCDASPADLCDGDLGVDNQVFTQELRLNTQFGKHYWIAGFYYIDESIEQDNTIDLFRDFRAALLQGPAFFTYDNTVDSQSAALFGQLDYTLNDIFTLTAGLRFTSDETDYTASSIINVPVELGDFSGVDLPGWNLSGNRKDDKLSGKIALVQKLGSASSLYYSVGHGFKSGGYNGGLAFTAEEAILSEYGPETLIATEFGGKFRLANSRMTFSLFHYDYQDQQVFMNQQSNQELSAPAQVLDNVGESQIYGAEFDFSHTFANNLMLQFGVGYVPEANLDEYEDAQGNIITNNRLPFSSEWNVNGLVNYQFDSSFGEWRLQLEFDHQSDFYFDQNQNPYAKQDAYTLWNGQLQVTKDNWTTSLWVKNIFDEQYSQIVFDLTQNFGLLQDLKGEARRVGLEIKYQF